MLSTRKMLYAIGFGALVGATIVGSPEAHANPIDDYGPSICTRFDAAEAITPAVLRSVGSDLIDQGYSPHDAANIVWVSVETYCPSYKLAVSAVATMMQKGIIR